MLNIKSRLRDRNSVAHVYRKGKSVRSGSLSLRYLKSSQESSRFAVVVSKKVAKNAPARNRIRRRVFEIVRANLNDVSPGWDVIVSVYDESVKSMPHEKLVDEVMGLLKKANLA